jgi:hypothetical protein
VISLYTDDCVRDADLLKAKGVVFVREPARMDYGGMDAVFDDTCGNLINLHQTDAGANSGGPRGGPPRVDRAGHARPRLPAVLPWT